MGGMPNKKLPGRLFLEIGAALLLVVVGASLFQFATGVIQPPLVAYLGLFFAAFLPVVVIKYMLLPAILFLCLLALFVFRYVGSRGMPLGDSYVAIMQSELSEVGTYLTRALTLEDVALALLVSILFVVLVGWMARRLREFRQSTDKRTYYSVALYLQVMVLVVFAVSGLNREISSSFQLVSSAYAAFDRERTSQLRLRDQLGEMAWPGSTIESDFEGTVVMVLGESTTKHHLGIYGYPRDTTPALAARRDSLLIHNDTISPHSHTVESVREILSTANFDDGIAFEDRPKENLLAALRASGFKTFWLSNQNKYGIWDNVVSILGQSADVSVFTRKSFGKVYSFKSFDEELLPHLDQALQDPAKKKFIVLHLYSTHWDYCSFLPEEARSVIPHEQLGPAFFGVSKDLSHYVNCYDNAVRYVDGVLEKVMQKVERQTDPSVMVYLADHGEDVRTGTGHESDQHRHLHVEVPNVWYFNAPAEKRFADQRHAFRANADERFKSSDLFHSLLDLVTEGSDLVREDRSLFAADYTPYDRTTVVRDEDGGFVRYDSPDPGDNKDYYELSRVNLKQARQQDNGHWRRIWAHRVDSLGKLLEAKTLFAGIELDLVYDGSVGSFHVYHPPKENHGLTLAEYLRASSDRKDLKYWFDWKNPSASELVTALEKLESLEAAYGIKDRSILEVPSDFSADNEAILARQGWQVSYYLPTDQIVACAKRGAGDCAEPALHMANRARSLGARYVSFDYRAWDFMKTHEQAFADFELLSWDLSKNTMAHDASGFDIDNRISVLLVGYPSAFHY